MQNMPHTNSLVLRKGQQLLESVLRALDPSGVMSITWPTGYGKSIGFALAWRRCHEIKVANRLLLVVANDTQRQQIINDFAYDCAAVGAPCNGGVWFFERAANDLKASLSGEAEVFVCTVQQLEASARGGVNTIKDLITMGGHRWMLGFDEFHHYGQDMAWGDAAKVAIDLAAFTLAMTATPYRRGPNHIFPAPSDAVSVSYTEACEQSAVKRMVCSSYEYKVTVVTQDNEVTNYTTSELLAQAPNGLDQYEERRQIRYSPQYIHPMINEPLCRLRMKRRDHPGKRLQMLVRAMSCRHAQVVCEQLKVFGDGLAIDWIGTGPNGRDDETNAKVRARFCPPKQKLPDGRCARPEPEIDVLVQVSMAGEGFDSVNVCEIVDLFPVSVTASNGRATQDKQFYGRGSRIIPGAEKLWLHVNIPTDHPLAGYARKELNEWMDACGECSPPLNDAEERQTTFDMFVWPDPPEFNRSIELLEINQALEQSETFKRFNARILELKPGLDKERDRSAILDAYVWATAEKAVEQSKKTRLAALREYCDGTVGRIAYIAAKQTKEVQGSVIGRFKKQINAEIIRVFGQSRDGMLTEDLEALAKWLKAYIERLRP